MAQRARRFGGVYLDRALGVGTSLPSLATLLDVNGAAQFGAGPLKSTFTAPGGAAYALQLSSARRWPTAVR